MRRNLVAVDEDAWLGLEEAIDVFEGAVGSLGVEKVCYRDKGEADYRPDDPEAPGKVGNTGRSHFGNHVVHL